MESGTTELTKKGIGMYQKQVFHDNTLAKFRIPLGAVEAGSEVRLRLYAEERGLMGVFLVVNDGGSCSEYPMQSEGNWWSVTLKTPEHAGVLFYHFVLGTSEGTVCYGAQFQTSCGIGEICRQNPLGFQITVIAPDFKTPDFFKKTIMYQVFPDRFARSGDPRPGIAYHKKMGRRAVLHEEFSGIPKFLPDPDEQYYSPTDYFGGTLRGIIEKLDYLSKLGVGALYLNPVFEADSNHRYNTADYRQIDPVLGTNEEFEELCREADRRRIKVILDGVFSHTGADSRYFNQKGNYSGTGAYQSQQSEYYPWYQFSKYPDEYACWWGFKTLPEVDETNPAWQEYVIDGADSVLREWMRKGASGYRLDVADELPDKVIEKMRTVIKEESPENLLLGEVWEDATTKQSYGARRKYALGTALDSVMNYPFRTAVLDFFTGKANARELENFLASQRLNYPCEMYYCLMNLLSSHDVERARTVLATGIVACTLTREQQAKLVVPSTEDAHAAKLLRMASALCFFLPGMPSIYYGDETGMHGWKDPFNRGPFAISDPSMQKHYEKLGSLRNRNDALKTGYVGFFSPCADTLGCVRFILEGKDAFGNEAKNGAFLLVLNRTPLKRKTIIDLYAIARGIDNEQLRLWRNAEFFSADDEFSGKQEEVREGLLAIELQPETAALYRLSYVRVGLG